MHLGHPGAWLRSVGLWVNPLLLWVVIHVCTQSKHSVTLHTKTKCKQPHDSRGQASDGNNCNGLMNIGLLSKMLSYQKDNYTLKGRYLGIVKYV